MDTQIGQDFFRAAKQMANRLKGVVVALTLGAIATTSYAQSATNDAPNLTVNNFTSEAFLLQGLHTTAKRMIQNGTYNPDAQQVSGKSAANEKPASLTTINTVPTVQSTFDSPIVRISQSKKVPIALSNRWRVVYIPRTFHAMKPGMLNTYNQNPMGFGAYYYITNNFDVGFGSFDNSLGRRVGALTGEYLFKVGPFKVGGIAGIDPLRGYPGAPLGGLLVGSGVARYEIPKTGLDISALVIPCAPRDKCYAAAAAEIGWRPTFRKNLNFARMFLNWFKKEQQPHI